MACPLGSNNVVRPNGPFGASCSPLAFLVKDIPRKDLFESKVGASDACDADLEGSAISSAMLHCAIESLHVGVDTLSLSVLRLV